MRIENVAGDVEGHGEPAQGHAEDEQTAETDVVVVFRVEEQVRDAEQRTELLHHHAEQHHPKHQQPLVFFQVQQQQLHREKIVNGVAVFLQAFGKHGTGRWWIEKMPQQFR
ncbi:MAG: hypothetical protein MUD08_14125 [Cytophagales bacterium]|nr:hypothetical protein [Cytophagales bacterium]